MFRRFKIGDSLLIFCKENNGYTGKLAEIQQDCIGLSGACIVDRSKDHQAVEILPGDIWYIQLSSIESFGARK